MNFTDWAQQELASLPNTKSAYLYKQQVIARMTERANEIIGMGISDNKVINELVISEFKNIKQEYYNTVQQKKVKTKKKKIGQLSVLGVFGYILAVIIAFLAISFISGAWGKTWLIIVCGILLPVAGLMALSAGKLSDKKVIFNFASRFLMTGAIFIFATVIYLVSEFLTPMPKAWLIFLFAIPMSMAVDCAMAFAAKQKSAIISLVLYIPVIATLLYVILGIIGILPWHPGWILIVLSLVADLGVIAAKILKGSKEEETEEEWEEN